MLDLTTSSGRSTIPSRLPSFLSLQGDISDSDFDAALTDHVTQIGNRRFFEMKLDEAFRSALPRPTVLLLDLDRFKAINDTLGHAVGDDLLRRVAERVQDLLEPGQILARLGGDEFGVLLDPRFSIDDIKTFATRLIDLLQRTYLIEGHPVNVGTSIGIALSSEQEQDRNQLLRNADLALYHSKNSGRGCFHFFDPWMEARAKARRSMEIDLRKAIALRQLELHYKPQIDVQSHRLIGFEALLRWKHPQHGLLMPSEFVPLAEEIGLINPIGEWVLKTACREAARWEGDIGVSVNVSPVQFEGNRLLGTVERALSAAAIPGHKLELEVTENVLLRDETSVVATIVAVRALGVQVAIDGFGTGIASLSQVANFPIDKIKIDRSLIGLSDTGTKERAIVRAIAALGSSLGLFTLAEGVDTRAHLATIQRDGCDAVQGYLSSQAVPASELKSAVATLLGVTQQTNPCERNG